MHNKKTKTPSRVDATDAAVLRILRLYPPDCRSSIGAELNAFVRRVNLLRARGNLTNTQATLLDLGLTEQSVNAIERIRPTKLPHDQSYAILLNLAVRRLAEMDSGCLAEAILETLGSGIASLNEPIRPLWGAGTSMDAVDAA